MEKGAASRGGKEPEADKEVEEVEEVEEEATLASKRGVMRALRACQFTYREGDPVVCGRGSDVLTTAARAASFRRLRGRGFY